MALDARVSVQVDKYCSSLDVMPTLSNLFGLDYDSRLIIEGRPATWSQCRADMALDARV